MSITPLGAADTSPRRAAFHCETVLTLKSSSIFSQITFVAIPSLCGAFCLEEKNCRDTAGDTFLSLFCPFHLESRYWEFHWVCDRSFESFHLIRCCEVIKAKFQFVTSQLSLTFLSSRHETIIPITPI